MANPVGDLVIGLSMDATQFSNTVSGINRQVKAAESAMKANLAVVGAAGDRYKTLEARVSGLSDMVTVNQRKIEMLREKYAQVSETFGETSEKAISLARQINNAVEKQQGWQAQIKASQQQMVSYNTKVDDLKEKLKTVTEETNRNIQATQESGKTYSQQKATLAGYSRQLSTTERIITEQRKQIERLSEAYGHNSKEVREARAELALFQRRASDLRGDIQRVSSAISGISANAGRAMDRIGQMNRRMEEMGRTAVDASDKIRNNLTPVMAVLGGIGLTTNASSFSDGLMKLENATNLTGESLDKAKESARNLWAEGFGSDISQATNAVIQVRNNMKALSEEDIEGATKSAMNLAQTFDSDVNEVTRAGNTLMQNYGMTSQEAFDMLAKGAKEGMNFSNEMFDNMSEYTNNFKDAGFNAEEMFSILSNGSEKGYNLDRLNDSLLEFKLQTEDTSKDYVAAMAKMSPATQKIFKDYKKGVDGVNVSDVYKSMIPDLQALKKSVGDKEFNVVGKSLFGTKFEDQSGEVILSMSAVNDAFNETNGTMEKVNETVEESFGQKLRSAINGLKNAFVPLGSAILDVVNIALPPLTAALKYISEHLENASESTKRFIGVFAIIAIAITPVILIVGQMIIAMQAILPIFTKIIGFASTFTSGFGGMATIIGAISNPITITIAAIAALAAGFYFLYQKSEPFRKLVGELGTMIKDTLLPVIKNMVKGVRTEFAGMMSVITANSGDIMKIINTVVEFISPIVKLFLKGLLFLVTSIFTAITGVIRGAFGVISGIIQIFAGLFTGNFSKMWEGIKTLFSSAVLLIWSIINLTFYGKILKAGKIFVNGIKSLFTTMWNVVKKLFTSGVNTVNKIFTTLSNFLKKTVTGISTFLRTIFTSIFNKIKDLANTFRNNFTTIFTNISTKVREIITKIVETMKNLFTSAFDRVRSTANKFKDGFIGIVTTLKDKVVSLVGKIVDKFKELPTEMVSALSKGKDGLLKAGKAMANGLIEGIAKGVNGVGEGVNWVLGKLDVETRIPTWNPPKYKNGTDYHQGGMAVVGDGNKHELIQTPDGRMMMSPNKSTLLNLPKGSSVLSGNDTANLLNSGIPFFKNGSKKAKETIGETLRNVASNVGNTVSSAAVATKNKAMAVGSSVSGAIGDVFDYMDNPALLAEKVLAKYLPKGTGMAGNIVAGLGKKVIGGMKSFITKQMENSFSFIPSGSGAKRWTSTLKKALSMNGLPTDGAYLKAWLSQISSESGGNPNVRQGVIDVNSGGNEAMGLVQVIPNTFAAYRSKSLPNDRTNPLANLYAGINYAKNRYGSRMLDVIGKGHGYANGGLVTAHQVAQIAEGNNPEMIIPLQKAKRGRAMQLLSKTEKLLGVDKSTGGTNANNNAMLTAIVERQDTQISLMQQHLQALTALLMKDNDIYLDGKAIYDSTNNYQAKANKINNIARGV